MKKIFALIMLLVFCSPVLAETIVVSPLWLEFCPKEFLNAEYDKMPAKPTLSKNEAIKELVINSIYAGTFSIFYLIHQRSATKKKLNENNYWATRKIAFDNEVNTCNSDKNNQSLCYMQVRQLEQQKNDQLENEKLAERKSYYRPRNNLSTQYQLNQMNANINNIKMQNQQMQFNNTLNTIKARGY